MSQGRPVVKIILVAKSTAKASATIPDQSSSAASKQRKPKSKNNFIILNFLTFHGLLEKKQNILKAGGLLNFVRQALAAS